MKQIVVYIHGQGGNSEEAQHYAPLFPEAEVIGFDYAANTPWEAKTEFSQYFDALDSRNCRVILVANSIGAYFAMHALSDVSLEKAYFISPVVDMEKLIGDMMTWANVTEDELCEKGLIETTFGQTLSWEYLCYVRENPIRWKTPTHILYGSRDTLTSRETISDFAQKHGATLTVMEDGEHWFHTPEQMAFLDEWIKNNR